jgi:hypothetical protein
MVGRRMGGNSNGRIVGIRITVPIDPVLGTHVGNQFALSKAENTIATAILLQP